MKKIIDVSGFGHSGKSAVSECLSDYENFFSFPPSVEFELFRVSGGILDLYYSIYKNWNLIRSRDKINEYKKLVKRIGTVQDYNKINTLWQSSGHGYNRMFNNRFLEISENYINKLVVFEQETFWPYEKLYCSEFDLLKEKIKAKIFKKISKEKIYFTNRNVFLNETSNYVHELFNEVEDKNSNNIVLNNAFEPFDPETCLKLVENSYSIIVDRDPRDIYASLISSDIGYIPKFEDNKFVLKQKKMMVGAENIDEFIMRYKTLKENVKCTINPKIIVLKYEDFVLKHNSEIVKIFNFLGIENPVLKMHTKFIPNDSKINIGLWKYYSETPEIKKIHKHLAEYCYQK